MANFGGWFMMGQSPKAAPAKTVSDEMTPQEAAPENIQEEAVAGEAQAAAESDMTAYSEEQGESQRAVQEVQAESIETTETEQTYVTGQENPEAYGQVNMAYQENPSGEQVEEAQGYYLDDGATDTLSDARSLVNLDTETSIQEEEPVFQGIPSMTEDMGYGEASPMTNGKISSAAFSVTEEGYAEEQYGPINTGSDEGIQDMMFEGQGYNSYNSENTDQSMYEEKVKQENNQNVMMEEENMRQNTETIFMEQTDTTPCIIGPDMVIEGDIYSTRPIILQGVVTGAIRTSSSVSFDGGTAQRNIVTLPSEVIIKAEEQVRARVADIQTSMLQQELDAKDNDAYNVTLGIPEKKKATDKQ